MELFPYCLAAVWGIVWASILQHTRKGRFLAQKRTWLTVVIGVGVDLLILLMVLPLRYWLMVVAVVALSAIGIIGRSLHNEQQETEAQIHDLTDTRAK